MSSPILNIDNKVKCRFCNQPLSNLQISRHQKFCSRKCKSESQKLKIFLTCNFCGKEFSVRPYLKRKSNFCSVKCYRDATRKKNKLTCEVCGKGFAIKAYLVKEGWGKYCSRDCQFSVYKRKRLIVTCKRCGKQFEVPPSVAKHKNYCSKKCSDDHKRDYVKKLCHNCHKYFSLPRWEYKKGKGSFCSRKCFQEYKGETSIESAVRKALKRKKIKFVQESKIGKYFVDFLLPEYSTVIECDGEYWHGSRKAQKRDFEKDKFIIQNGYRVFRIKEKDIKDSAFVCVSDVLDCAGGKILSKV